MKIRKGFVSNSSSSSFIIGLANISKYEKKNKKENISYDFILDPDRLLYDLEYNPNNKKLQLRGCNDYSVEIKAKPGDKILWLNSYGPDPDDFDDDYEYVDLSDFDQNDIDKYEKIKKLGGDAMWWAGFCG